MASCQRRGDKWQFRIVAKGILPKPVFFTFEDKEEGERYVAKLESLIRPTRLGRATGFTSH